MRRSTLVLTPSGAADVTSDEPSRYVDSTQARYILKIPRALRCIETDFSYHDKQHAAAIIRPAASISTKQTSAAAIFP